MSWKISCNKNKDDFKLSFFDSVDLINPTHWNSVVQDKNIYLSLSYLKSLETALSDEMEFRYIIMYNHKSEPVSIAVVQLLNFVDKNSKYNELLCKVGDTIKNKLLDLLDIKVMVCGNVFACGENGFMHIDSVDSKQAYSNLSKALYKLRLAEKANRQVSIVLLKEFWPENFEKTKEFKNQQFREFEIDVNMLLDIHPSWKTIDDYLQSMTTKFRTKAKSCFKKSKDITVKEFSVEDIENNINRIEELYDDVIEKADFKFGKLNGEAFKNLKQNLGDQFCFRAYYLESKIVGFSTAYISNGVVDAGYVGIDYDYNFDYAIYQLMLYDYVEIAINSKSKELRLGRTAEEIKSCLGAKPVDMKLYLRHRNSVSNQLLKPIIDSISPSEYTIRQPFKAEFSK